MANCCVGFLPEATFALTVNRLGEGREGAVGLGFDELSSCCFVRFFPDSFLAAAEAKKTAVMPPIIPAVDNREGCAAVGGGKGDVVLLSLASIGISRAKGSVVVLPLLAWTGSDKEERCTCWTGST